jgi:hypothetical protein
MPAFLCPERVLFYAMSSNLAAIAMQTQATVIAGTATTIDDAAKTPSLHAINIAT